MHQTFLQKTLYIQLAHHQHFEVEAGDVFGGVGDAKDGDIPVYDCVAQHAKHALWAAGVQEASELLDADALRAAIAIAACRSERVHCEIALLAILSNTCFSSGRVLILA